MFFKQLFILNSSVMLSPDLGSHFQMCELKVWSWNEKKTKNKQTNQKNIFQEGRNAILYITEFSLSLPTMCDSSLCLSIPNPLLQKAAALVLK